jgi:hypothetical protein
MAQKLSGLQNKGSANFSFPTGILAANFQKQDDS